MENCIGALNLKKGPHAGRLNKSEGTKKRACWLSLERPLILLRLGVRQGGRETGSCHEKKSQQYATVLTWTTLSEWFASPKALF